MIKPLFLIGWLICSVFLHAEFVDLQAEPKFVAYSNSIDYSGHSIGEAFYHADTFAAVNRNVMPLPARATGTHGLPSVITPSQAPTAGRLAERYGASTSASRLGVHGTGPHHGAPQLGSISEHQASHASATPKAPVKEVPWSSKSVRDAVKSLEMGQIEVRVASRMEAEELLLGRYQGNGFKNTTGMRPTEAKNLVGKKEGTYHWDIGKDAYPHEASHLQIHDGPFIIRIYFPD